MSIEAFSYAMSRKNYRSSEEKFVAVLIADATGMDVNPMKLVISIADDAMLSDDVVLKHVTNLMSDGFFNDLERIVGGEQP